MQAVIRTGGKQYYVGAGDILEVEKLAGDVGDTITLDDVLMIASDDDVTVGQPTVNDAAVTAKITGQYRGNKILVFRYRPKKRIRVRRGHRQYLTRLEIQSVRFGDLESVAPEPVTPEPIIEEVQAEEVEAEEVMAEEASSTDETVAEATEETVEAEDNTAADIVAEVEADSGDDDSNDDSDAHANDSDTDIDVAADEASDKSKE